MLKKISKSDFERLCVGAEVLLEDLNGPKVWLLTNQQILKTFRRKHLVSSQMWMPYATRFAKNTELLKKRGIPNVQITSTFQIPEIKRQAVLYELLEGETLRDWIVDQDESSIHGKLEKLGRLTAELHSHGIMFRSHHLGNVLVMNDGELGLIDISDMSFRCFGALSNSQRNRNFHHMDRYDADRIALCDEGGQRFLKGYVEYQPMNASQEQILRKNFEDIFNKYIDLKN